MHKTNICASNIHNNTIHCLLLHVSAKLLPLHEAYTPIFKTHYSVLYYNSGIYFIVMIPAIEFNNVRSHKM